MHASAQNFVERIALLLEADGLPRIAGRIFGYLLVHDGAYTLDDLAEALQVSKASVSTNARLLEGSGLLERTAAPGDRRDYYQMGADAWARRLRVARRQWEGMREALAEGAAQLPPELEAGRRRLHEAERFHTLIVDEADRLAERWQELRRRHDTAGRVIRPFAVVE
jgi:DNA-binding transcriptional regulator GbsR (MarR family)